MMMNTRHGSIRNNSDTEDLFVAIDEPMSTFHKKWNGEDDENSISIASSPPPTNKHHPAGAQLVYSNNGNEQTSDNNNSNNNYQNDNSGGLESTSITTKQSSSSTSTSSNGLSFLGDPPVIKEQQASSDSSSFVQSLMVAATASEEEATTPNLSIQQEKKKTTTKKKKKKKASSSRFRFLRSSGTWKNLFQKIMGRYDPWESIFDINEFPEIGPIIAREEDNNNNKLVGGVYKRKRFLGSGTFGRVFVGRRLRQRRRRQQFYSKTITDDDEIHEDDDSGGGRDVVAIKQLNKSKAKKKQHIRCVNREIHILRVHGNNHPNIIGYYESIHTTSSVYLVMEKATMDLWKAIGVLTEDYQHEKQFDFQRQVLKGILNAISYLHSHGIYHLDLKPQNILISLPSQNHDGYYHHGSPPRIEARHVRIADFGMSQVAKPKNDGGATNGLRIRAGRKVGTVGFMAPELVCGEGGDAAAADIWSIGCIFHEMSWGGLPTTWFQKNPSWTVFSDYLDDYATEYLSTNPSHSYYLDLLDFELSMLDINPEERASAADLLQHPLLKKI